jgi:hypothetical protein
MTEERDSSREINMPEFDSVYEDPVLHFLDLYTFHSEFTKEMAEFDPDGVCVVCLDVMNAGGETVRKLFRCSHIFHERCLYDWA